MSKMKFGIFLTDASFDYKTKVSSIGMINISNKKEYTKITKAYNPTDAEKQGVQEVLNICQREKIFNVIIICDNKQAVQDFRKEYFRKDKVSDFWYLQFLWVPREYNQLADFLSKNINENDIEKFKEMRTENTNSERAKLDNKISKKYVKDIEYNKETSNVPLLKRINQFKLMMAAEQLDINTFKSNIIKELVSDNMSLKVIEDLIIEPEEINALENEIKKIKNIDSVMGIVIEIIKDTILFI